MVRWCGAVPTGYWERLEGWEKMRKGGRDSLAAGNMWCLAVQQDKAGVLGFQNSVPIIFTHLFLDFLNDFLVPFFITQVDFRKDEIQSGWRILHNVLDGFPVFRLRGVLITSDDTPLRQIEAFFRKQNTWNFQPQIGEVPTRRRRLRSSPPGAALTSEAMLVWC